jgi:RNA polymerase sigma-70 factor (sigma-E family)
MPTEYERYAMARAPALRRTAYLLCGDWARAEDLVQSALVKLYVAWRRAAHADNLDAYVRKILLRCWLDENRRGHGREVSVGELFDTAGTVVVPPEEQLALRDALLGALRRMPAGQRACVVLRYWEDLSVAQTAALLDITESTVKSQSSRGLALLRELAGDLAPAGWEGADDD